MKRFVLPTFHRLFLAAIEAVSAVYAGVGGGRARFGVPPDGEFASGKGRLAVRGGWRFLHLEGGDFERGVQQGALLGPVIGDLLHEYLKAITWLRGMRRAEIVRRGRRLEPFIPQAFIEEMRGIARGAGVPYEDILMGHTFLEAVQAASCSCYAAYGRATRNGRLVFGRNLDFMSMGVAHRCQVVAFHKPEDGIPFVSVAWPGWCGTLTAVNLEGLCVGPLNVPRIVRGEDMIGQPYVILFRRMVQEARTCDEAVELLRTSRRTFSNNVLIAQTQPHPRAVVAEYTAKEIAVREPRDGNDFIAATNHFRKLGREAEWPDEQGFSRYPKIVRALGGARGRATMRTPVFQLPRVALPNSLHSLVAEPERRVLRLSLGRIPAAAGPYRTIRYDENGFVF